MLDVKCWLLLHTKYNVSTEKDLTEKHELFVGTVYIEPIPIISLNTLHNSGRFCIIIICKIVQSHCKTIKVHGFALSKIWL